MLLAGAGVGAAGKYPCPTGPIPFKKAAIDMPSFTAVHDHFAAHAIERHRMVASRETADG
jgi:hypothetical protein